MREIGQTVPDIENEVLVTLIGDLHQKQEAESRATEHLVIDQVRKQTSLNIDNNV